MKINGIEQVNIGTEEEPYWIPKDSPFPIKEIKKRQQKLAKEWADEVLNSDEGKELQRNLDKEFIEYVVFGKTPYYGNKETFKDLKDYIETELHLTPSDIIDRFEDVLTEEQIKQLGDYEKSN